MHRAVLLNEVLKVLDPKPGEFFADGTLDGGEHGQAIIKRLAPSGKFLGVDWDEAIVKKFRSPSEKVETILVGDNFKNMKEILLKNKLGKIDGLLLDLGFSSEQLENSGRGFSFLRDEPLLMTYSKKARPVYVWLETLKESVLAKIVKDYGEEKFAGRIAKAIKKNLPIRTSSELAKVVRNAVPRGYEHGRIHPATRTFQALRIFVNDELNNLKKILEDLPMFLNPRARVAVISFHSLEDRIVKQGFRTLAAGGDFEILTRKPVTPTAEEISLNPRSRSAKLRVIKRRS